MNVEIKMPDLATTESEITIIRWLVDVGQPVRIGQPLLEIETDKASMDVEAVAGGTLTAIHAQSGERVAVGQVIAIVTTAEKVSEKVSESYNDQSNHVIVGALREMPSPDNLPPIITQSDKPRTSLFARNKAARDQMAQTRQPVDQSIPLNITQQETARRLQSSKQTIPHFYLTTSANAERMGAIRQSSSQKLVWDAFFVQAVARALKTFERMQYRFEGDRLMRRDTDAVGIAVDIDDDLYVVPIANPLALTLQQISDQITTRADQIRQGDSAAKKLGETSITITNLGAEGIESFAAIINPPEVAILAIGKIAPTILAQDNQITIQKRVSMTLSVDHRIVNGKYAARFLSRVVQELEAL